MDQINIQDHSLNIHPVSFDDLYSILDVYRQCEDFLSLGPTATASMEMVEKDIESSKNEGGLFCGVYTAEGKMIGVLDFIPGGYKGDPTVAFLELLMIAEPQRGRGIGKAVVEAFENEIRKDKLVSVILAGVQVNNPRAIQFWERNGYQIVGGPELQPDHTTTCQLRKYLSEQAGEK